MKILLNGAWRELVVAGAQEPAPAPPTLETLLLAWGYGGATVATAVNGEFVPARARPQTPLQDGDRIEVLAPMQGG